MKDDDEMLNTQLFVTFILAVAIAFTAGVKAAKPHDIYTNVRGKDMQLCCGANDCSATTYRERGGDFEFLTRENHWVHVPQDRITFLPIPGDPPSNDSHHAHICYRDTLPYDNTEELISGDGQTLHLYCAFIPPSGY